MKARFLLTTAMLLFAVHLFGQSQVNYNGDINHDGQLTILDIEELVNIILNQKNAEVITIERGTINYVQAEQITNISLGLSSFYIKEGDTETLLANILPTTASNQSLNWISSDPSVATISEGLITGISEGKAIITCSAKDNSGVYATCNVEVTKSNPEPGTIDYGKMNISYWHKPRNIGAGEMRFHVNNPMDKTNTYQYANGTTNTETFFMEGEGRTREVEGFVRNINDAWVGMALNFSGGNYSKFTKPIYYFHPQTNSVVVRDSYSGDQYHFAVDYDDLWSYTGRRISNRVSLEAFDYVKNAERTEQINTTRGIYNNINLYAYKNGADRQKIAEINRYTGDIWYMYNDRAKEVLNATGHRRPEVFVYIGIFLPNEQDIACSINYNAFPENIFTSSWSRPLDILPIEGSTLIDAGFASYISLFDKFNIQDWRDYKIVDKSQSPMDYKNVWLLAFYGVNKMTLHLDKVTTDMNGHNISRDLLSSVNNNIKISYVERNKTTEIGKLGEVATKIIDLTVYNKESMGVKSTYDAIVEKFGYLKYENKGANVTNFKFIVPVTFGYDWGEITTNMEIQVAAQ